MSGDFDFLAILAIALFLCYVIGQFVWGFRHTKSWMIFHCIMGVLNVTGWVVGILGFLFGIGMMGYIMK